MEDGDFPEEEVCEQVGIGAMRVMEALEVPEVQEAMLAWSNTTFDVVRCFERADIPTDEVAGILASGLVTVILRMGADE